MAILILLDYFNALYQKDDTIGIKLDNIQLKEGMIGEVSREVINEKICN